MARVSESVFEVTGKTSIICDFSPPRSGLPSYTLSSSLDVDFLLINRNPGRSVRTDSAMLAAALKQQTGQETIFALLTRDMNRLALQSYLLGAQMLGLENTVVAGGDPFTGRDAQQVRTVADYRPTELIAAIADMNLGRDFRGRTLEAPSGFCVGATLDPGGELARQVELVEKKISAGAEFLVTQSIFHPGEAAAFEAAYLKKTGHACPVPIYWGLQMLEAGSVSFGAVPPELRRQLEAGRSGVEIALEVFDSLAGHDCRNIYLLPAILRGGERGYNSAQRFLSEVRKRDG